MSLAKVLFLLNRYITLIYLAILVNAHTNRAVQSKFCLPWFHTYSWIAIFILVVISTLMLLRTWALWGRSRNILISLSVSMMVCVLGASGTALYISLTVVKLPSVSSIRPCEETFPKESVLVGFLIFCILFDSTVLVLTLIKTVPAREPNGLTPLTNRLLKDGVEYFLLIFLISIANIIMMKLVPVAIALTLFTLYLVMASTLCSRLILNLRGTIFRPSYNNETSFNLKTIVFERPPSDGITNTRLDLGHDVEHGGHAEC